MPNPHPARTRKPAYDIALACRELTTTDPKLGRPLHPSPRRYPIAV